MKLMELCEEERPREKMLCKGASSLNNVELLAILIRTGTRQMNAVDVARQLLKNAEGKLGKISSMSIEKICGTYGIGRDKAATVAAAFELGRRCAQEQVEKDACCLCSSEAVFKLMHPFMKNLAREECWILMLNKGNRLIGKEMISIGNPDSTSVDHSVIACRCMEKHASGAILVHNHPSGNPTPSKADIQVTTLIRKTLSACGVSLLDHVIVSPGSWYSFSDESIGRIG